MKNADDQSFFNTLIAELAADALNERKMASILPAGSLFVAALEYPPPRVMTYESLFIDFLVASSHLYKRVCQSVGRSVRRSVGPSVRRSVGPSTFVKK